MDFCEACIKFQSGAGPGRPARWHPFTVGVLALRNLLYGGDDGAPCSARFRVHLREAALTPIKEGPESG